MFEIIKNNFLAAIFFHNNESLLDEFARAGERRMFMRKFGPFAMRRLCDFRRWSHWTVKFGWQRRKFSRTSTTSVCSATAENPKIKRREFGIISLSRDTNLGSRHSRRNALQFNIMQTCSNVCLWEHTKAGRKCTQYASRNLQNLLFIIKFPHPAVGEASAVADKPPFNTLRKFTSFKYQLKPFSVFYNRLTKLKFCPWLRLMCGKA